MIGKVNDDFFTKYILPLTGADHADVIVGPRMGADAAILKTGNRFMAVAEDPIFPGAATTPDDFGFLTVHIGASDVAVTGIKPQFMTYSLLLPPGTDDGYVSSLVAGISRHAASLGISIVGGHTGYYGAVTIPTIGGITVWGVGDSYVTPSGSRAGDRVLMTKGAAIEAAGLIAYELGGLLAREGVDPEMIRRARERFFEISVVRDAEIVWSASLSPDGAHRGVHAMHDATEGGVARGLWEMAQAAGVGLRIDKDKILLPPDIKTVLDHFGLNPYEIISEGTLLLTCGPESAPAILAALQKEGIAAADIGEVVAAEEGCFWVEKGRKSELTAPLTDAFWDVFFGALALQSDGRRPEERALCAELDEAAASFAGTVCPSLLPEIGANIAYTFAGAPSSSDAPGRIAAIPGRIHRVKGKIVPFGTAEMNCSRYMGNSLLKIREFFPAVRCVINLENSAAVRAALSKTPLWVVSMPDVPGLRQTDEAFFADLEKTLKAAAETGCGGCRGEDGQKPAAPDVIDVPDRINLERLILVTADSLPALLAKIDAISARLPPEGMP